MSYNLNVKGVAKVSDKANSKGNWVVTLTDGGKKAVTDDNITNLFKAYAVSFSEQSSLSPQDVAALVVTTDKEGDDFLALMSEHQADDTDTGNENGNGNAGKPDVMQQLKDSLAKEGKAAPMMTGKPGTKDTAPKSATGRDTLAIELGHKLENAPDLLGNLREGYEIKERMRVLPVEIAWKLSKLYTKEDRNRMPEPGSEEPKDAKDRRPNTIYDIRAKVGEGSWYGDLAEGIPWYGKDIGVPLQEITDQIEKQGKNPKIMSLKRRLQGRKSSLAGHLRGGIALLNKMDMVSTMTSLEATFCLVKDPNGQLAMEDTNTPILVAYKDEAIKKDPTLKHQYILLGAGSFMLVNLDKVAKSTNQLKDFVAERGVIDGTKEVLQITTVDEMDSALTSLWAHLDSDTGFQSALNKKLTKDNLEFIDTLFAIKDKLVGICARTSVKKLHEEFVRDEEARKEKEKTGTEG